jgi:hypothetical protein
LLFVVVVVVVKSTFLLLTGLGLESLTLFLGELLTDTPHLRDGVSMTELGDNLTLAVLSSDLAWADATGWTRHSKDSLVSDLLDSNQSITRRVAGTDATILAWEHNELALVELETVDIDLETLVRAVVTTMVDSNTDRAGLLWRHTSSAELIKSETTAETSLGVVLVGLTTHDWAEKVHWTRSETSSLGIASRAASSLLGWLIEPGLDITLPVLAEVILVDNVVVLWHDELEYLKT